MLNADDQFTYRSLQRLREAVATKKALVLWIGAGASVWAGLPSWKECARVLRKTFLKQVAGFDASVSRTLIERGMLPELFQLCRDTDEALYNRFMVDSFTRQNISPVYSRFIERVIHAMTPLQIVTTNVDLCLEQNIGNIDVIEKNDLERLETSIQLRSAFIAKLHDQSRRYLPSSSRRKITESL